MGFDLSAFDTKSRDILEHTNKDISSLRTGKATPQLLDSVVVEAYGGRMKLVELANISAPDSTLLTISPWDKSLLGAIEKGIVIASLNLQPVVDKDMIRISVPPLTEERRREMVKILSQKIEASRVLLRTLRTDVKKDIERQKGQPGVSEDDIKSEVEQLDSKLKAALDKLEQLFTAKEAELMKL